MTQPAKVQEPSMEEILASIRRIIADDEADTPATRPSAAKGAAGASARVEPPSKPAAKAAASRADSDIAALMADFDAPAAPPPPEDDVLELTDDMALSAPPDAAAPDVTDLDFDKVEPANDREFNDTVMTSEHRYPAVERPSGADRGGDGPAASEMLSRSTVSAVESAFNSLAHTVLSNNARTLEDLVREMLRPMLKSWLDDNLPGLVERIVKAEIERVSRGR